MKNISSDIAQHIEKVSEWVRERERGSLRKRGESERRAVKGRKKEKKVESNNIKQQVKRKITWATTECCVEKKGKAPTQARVVVGKSEKNNFRLSLFSVDCGTVVRKNVPRIFSERRKIKIPKKYCAWCEDCVYVVVLDFTFLALKKITTEIIPCDIPNQLLQS